MSALPRSARWFMAPWLIGLVVWIVGPVLVVVGLSLTADRAVSSGGTAHTGPGAAVEATEWVGLAHYRFALAVDRSAELTARDPWYDRLIGGRPRDPRFAQALYNTLYFTVIAVPLELLAALGAALLLSQPVRGQSVFRTLAYLPHLLGGVATLLIWSWLLNPRFGWVNQAIAGVYAGLDPLVRALGGAGTAEWPLPGWLYSPAWCKPAVIVMHTWTLGGAMLIFLAALQRVPRAYYEAAALDGAGPLRRWWHVTLPQLSPVILFNATVGVLLAMQSFNESYVLEHWSQQGGLVFYVRYLYELAFEPPYRVGYACALAVLMLAVLMVLVGPAWWLARRWVYYAAEPRL